MKKTSLFYNADCLERPQDFVRQAKKIKDIAKTVRSASHELVSVPIRFSGKSVLDVQKNVVQQVRKQVVSLLTDRAIFCFGDGGNGLMLHAATLAKHGLHRDITSMVPPIFMAAGGTMNLLSKTLSTADQSALEKYLYLEGDIPEKEIFVRQLLLEKRQGLKITEAKHFPWVSFAGIGMDARLMHAFESVPRNHSLPYKVAMTLADAAKELILEEREVSLRAAIAIPLWGIINLSPRFEALEREKFFEVRMGPTKGLSAVRQIITNHLVGLSPMFSEQIWSYNNSYAPPENAWWSDMYRDAQKMQPKQADIVQSDAPGFPGTAYFHLDGFPVKESLKPDEKVTITLSTNPRKKVSVYSPFGKVKAKTSENVTSDSGVFVVQSTRQ